jgi:predicted transcriptional regulator
MENMSHTDNRKFRINQLRSQIKEAMMLGQFISEDKLIAQFSLTFGLSRRKIMEYLAILEQMEEIVIEDGKIWTKEAYRIDKLNGQVKEEKEEIEKIFNIGKE